MSPTKNLQNNVIELFSEERSRNANLVHGVVTAGEELSANLAVIGNFARAVVGK